MIAWKLFSLGASDVGGRHMEVQFGLLMIPSLASLPIILCATSKWANEIFLADLTSVVSLYIVFAARGFVDYPFAVWR